MQQDVVKLAVPSLKESDESTPPILTKASSDSGDSSVAHSHSNEVTFPESPSHMLRSLLGHQSLFQEEESRSPAIVAILNQQARSTLTRIKFVMTRQ